MPILNFTTGVPPEKTAGEIQARLVRARAQAVMTEFDRDGVLTHLSFRVETRHGPIAFRLPANVEGVRRLLVENPKVPRRLQTKAHAARVAWRIVKTWVDAQLAVIEAGMAELPEVFLPYAQTASGETVYERFVAQGLPALSAPPSAPMLPRPEGKDG